MRLKSDLDLRIACFTAWALFVLNGAHGIWFAGEGNWPFAVGNLAWAVTCVVWAKFQIPAQYETRNAVRQHVLKAEELLKDLRNVTAARNELNRLRAGILAIRNSDESDLGEYSRWVAVKCDELLEEERS